LKQLLWFLTRFRRSRRGNIPSSLSSPVSLSEIESLFYGIRRTQGVWCAVEIPAAWLILRLGPQTSWPFRGAHLALIVCFCTRKAQRSPHDLLAQAAIFFCKRVGDLNSTGDIEPCVFWAWVAPARIRNISPVAKKEMDPSRIGFAHYRGSSYLLCRTIERSFGHKNSSRVVSPHANL